MKRRTPSYKGLWPASTKASRIASAASKKKDTRPERLLRVALEDAGLNHEVDVVALPGRPDVVIPTARLAVFCDGDFWHGRNLQRRLAKLRAGHNASYWISKIRANVSRDRRVKKQLTKLGWSVIRLWEGDVRAAPNRAAARVLRETKALLRIQERKVSRHRAR
jgi:DNA mismatch endonuclease, patch repair protein